LPSVNSQLSNVKLKSPIEQHMLGRGGLFRQENVEKRRIMSVREWSELCAKEELRAPGVDDIGLHARATNGSVKPRARRARKKRESETAEPHHLMLMNMMSTPLLTTFLLSRMLLLPPPRAPLVVVRL